MTYFVLLWPSLSYFHSECIYFYSEWFYLTYILGQAGDFPYIWNTIKLIFRRYESRKEEIAEEPFVIRPYLKSELAHLYNPYVPLVYAMRKMREWIRNNKELYDAMYSGGEGKNDHAYSARQVRLIVRYLDEPWISLGQVLISYNENKISYNEIEISYNEIRISYNEAYIIMYTCAGAREYSFI